MIKSERTSAIPLTPHPGCFVEHDSSLGISFEIDGGPKRFALNSFLSAVDYVGPDELVFRYTSCTITVRGRVLDPLWNAVCAGALAKIIAGPNGKQVNDETMVTSIAIENASDTPKDPVFPKEAVDKPAVE